MTDQDVVPTPGADLEQPSPEEEALYWLRDTLGKVARRHPQTRRLGSSRYRLELLAEACDRETFLLVTSWLGSEAVPSITSKRAYADDVLLWADVARDLGRHERLFIGAITPGIIETWTKIQKAHGKAPRTINRRLSVLTSLMQYAAWKQGKPIFNPVTKYDRSKVDPHDEVTATPILEVREFQKVVKSAKTPRQALVPVLIYTVAARVTECCTAQLTALKTRDGERVLDLSRKGGKPRVWPIPAQLARLIATATEGRRSGPILLDDDNQAMDRHAVARLLGRLGAEAGVLPGRRLTPHVLRASMLTHMHDQGISEKKIRDYADHAKMETTLRYIRRRDTGELRAKHAASAASIYEHLIDKFIDLKY